MAAQRNVCSSPGIITWCARRICVFAPVLLLFLAQGSDAFAARVSPAEESGSDSRKSTTLFHASLNETTFEESIVETPSGLFSGSAQQTDAPPVIERIVFEGNR